MVGYIAGVQYVNKHEIEGFKVTPLEPDERSTATQDPGQTNFPVNKDNEALGEAIDSVLTEMRESGALDKIAKKVPPRPRHDASGRAEPAVMTGRVNVRQRMRPGIVIH